ncbi:ROK family transcriptional regulator [Fictibacillus enclensis]|uniref:ROK family transcriptional regulator n=1 Tax=Fictibacillus enclensis TaxID=1017270 RepID=UPI0025A02804|nr:ROK family transcriptional regulator [Fictibacillus enclensis]MDM5340518.1 ROK family transcriptional regulator [Fictibacillus enclensis]
MKSKGTAVLREQNQKKILDYIRAHQPCSRLEISQDLGLSKNTISLIVEQLLKDGIVAESGIKELHGAGRPRIMLTLVPDAFQSIGLLVQQDKLEYVVLDFRLNEIEEGELRVNCDHDVLQELIRLAEQLSKRYPNSKGIGIGIPGLVDPETGYVYQSSKLDWKNIPLKQEIERIVNQPVAVFNSVKIAAEGMLKDENPLSSYFYIRISEGVGGAYIINDHIVNGNSWTAGEIGHISVDPEGPLCKCGQRGCLEQMIGLNALKEYANQEMGYQMNTNDWIKMIQNDSRLNKEITRYGLLLGRALVQVIHLINPQKIIIDSPYNIFDPFKTNTLEISQKHTLPYAFEKTEVTFTNERFSPAKGAAISILLND